MANRLQVTRHCPFCGSGDARPTYDMGYSYCVRCKACGCEVHGATLEAAVKRWNNQAGVREPDVTELVTAIASGEPVTEAHRDLARAIQERWGSEAKR